MTDLLDEKAPYANAPRWIFVGVVVLWASNWILAFCLFDKFDQRGQFGDMFGAINALFSGLSLAGIVCAILLQAKEISLTNKVIIQTKQNVDEQQKQIDAKEFGEKFFQILNYLHKMRTSIRYKYNEEEIIEGVEIFTKYLDVMSSRKEDYCNELRISTNTLVKFSDFYRKYLEDVDTEFSEKISSYFNLLYILMKMIDKRTNADRFDYADILKSQLYNSECEILLMKCQDKRYLNKFKILVENYKYCEKLQKSDMFFPILLDIFKK